MTRKRGRFGQSTSWMLPAAMERTRTQTRRWTGCRFDHDGALTPGCCSSAKHADLVDSGSRLASTSAPPSGSRSLPSESRPLLVALCDTLSCRVAGAIAESGGSVSGPR